MTRLRWTAWIFGAGVAVAAALTACGQRAEHMASPPEEGRTFRSAPLSVPAEAGLLAGTPGFFRSRA